MSSTSPLPKRCMTCGGKGWYKVPDFIDTDPKPQDCDDCVGGVSGWVTPDSDDD